MTKPDTFEALLAEFPEVDLKHNKQLIGWLRRLFELVDKADNGLIPNREEIAQAIQKARNLRPNPKLLEVSPNRRHGNPYFARWLLNYALNTLVAKPSYVKSEACCYYFAGEARQYLGMSVTW